MSTATTTTTKPPTTDKLILSQTLAALTPPLEIITRFHHRNKNQHRIAKWWAHADMLRRQLRKFLLAVEGRLGRLEAGWTPPGSGSNSRRSKARSKGKRDREAKGVEGRRDPGGGEDQGERDEISARAEYLRRELTPRAYLSFTQLTADRQFAHMGLMLLGVLAQVDSTISIFATRLVEDSNNHDQAGPAQISGPSTDGAPGQLDTASTIPEAMSDAGVAVSREEMQTDIPMRGSISIPKTSRHSRDEPRDSTEQTPAPRDETKPRPKKKKPGGDEFDDIFGSLENTRKRKKKKKGDEFDDIFASL